MNLSWLKKVEFVVPFILPFIPGVPPAVIPFIVKGIQTAEAVEGATGAQKLAIAQAEVANGVAAVNAAKPGTIDETNLNSAVTNGINTAVAVTNLIHPKES
jgi:hypothetical protein